MLTATYQIPEVNLTGLIDAIEKLSRRSEKLGLPEIMLEKTGEFEDRPFRRDREGTVIAVDANRVETTPGVFFIRYVAVKVTGQTPRLAGWEFIATLQHMEVEGESANLLKCIPSCEGSLPAEFRTRTPENCDHCHKLIRTRKETFVVRNTETGEWKQVGRSCTQDFLGGQDPHKVTKGLEYLLQATTLCEDAEDECGFGGGSANALFSLKTFLGHVAACIRVGGWISRGQARNDFSGRTIATADDALEAMFPNMNTRLDWIMERTPNAEDLELVTKAMEYARNDLGDAKDENDYLYNLWVAVNQTNINRKVTGIAASLISHFLRVTERLVQKQYEAKVGANSVHFGTVGERINFYATLVRVNNYTNDFGTGSIYNLITREGNMVVWFTGGVGDLKVGEEYLIRATVKKHDERNNVKQTVITRADVYHGEARTEFEAKEAKKAERAAKKAAKAKKVDSEQACA